jgi:hypothetical protein
LVPSWFLGDRAKGYFIHMLPGTSQIQQHHLKKKKGDKELVKKRKVWEEETNKEMTNDQENSVICKCHTLSHMVL